MTREFLPSAYYCNVDFVRLYPVRGNHRLLDAGCGGGRHSAEAALHARQVVAMDINRGNLLDTAKLAFERTQAGAKLCRIDLVLADAQHLPFRDAAFDRVLCTEVMEHLPDDRLALHEMDRVLKDGGLAAISAPAFVPESLFWRLAKHYPKRAQGHIRIYRPGELAKRIRDTGLRLYAIRGRHAHQALLWFFACLSGLPERESRFVHLLRSFMHYQEFRPDKDRTFWRGEAVLNFVIPKDRIIYARKIQG